MYSLLQQEEITLEEYKMVKEEVKDILPSIQRMQPVRKCKQLSSKK